MTVQIETKPTFSPHPAARPLNPPGTGKLVLAAAVLGTGMSYIDSTSINIAIPAIQADFSSRIASLQWVIGAYTLFLSAFLLVGSSLGDRFGRERIFRMGAILFALASVLCGFAPNAATLIGFRALQGCGGALLIPGSLALITAHFPPDERGKAIGIWSALAAVIAAIGPVLGGWMIGLGSWRWIFFLNVPVAAAMIVILARIPVSGNRQPHGKLDWAGGLLATAGLGSLAFGLIGLPEHGLSDWRITLSMGTGASLFLLFVFHESRTASPMMPLSLFQSADFSAANLYGFLIYVALCTVMFLLPMNLVQIQGYQPLAAGSAFLPYIVIVFALSKWVGDKVVKIGYRAPLAWGGTLCAFGYALMCLPGLRGGYWISFFPPVAMIGLGMALSVTAMTTAVMASVEPERAGLASGINNTLGQLSTLVAVTLCSVIMVSGFNGSIDHRINGLAIAPEAKESILKQKPRLAEIEVPSGMDPAESESVHDAVRLSFISGFRRTMAFCATLSFVCGLLAAFCMKNGNQPRGKAG